MAPGLFKHPLLDKTRSQIRLLEILPQPDSSLQYNLTTFDVSSCPPYIALSYVWGRDNPNNTIVINGNPFSIRSNLSCALPRLASLQGNTGTPEFERSEKHFWIDAICINQNDTKERNHQVEMMKEIFSRATLTIAWLGRKTENLRSLRPVASVEEHAHVIKHNSRRLSKKTLEKVARNRYFTRIWIVQEIVLSRDIWVMCGSEICTWGDLETSWSTHRGTMCLEISEAPTDYNHKVDLPTLRNSVTSPLLKFHTAMWSRSVHNSNGFRLDDLIYIFSDWECCDPRDRVYALLGLVSSKSLDLNPLPVDYDINTEDLFELVYKHVSPFTNRNEKIGHLDRTFNLQMALGLHNSFRHISAFFAAMRLPNFSSLDAESIQDLFHGHHNE